MKTIDELLGEHDFFKNFSDAERKTISGCGKLEHFESNVWLAREGDPAQAFYLIRRGQASIEVHMPQYGGMILQTVKPGDIVGWSWLFPPYRWTSDVKARDDLTVIAFDGLCLREKCERDPGLGYRLMKDFARIMTQRLQDTRLQLLDIYGRNQHHVDT
jgi:CRP-like cAMP-binding protein